MQPVQVLLRLRDQRVRHRRVMLPLAACVVVCTLAYSSSVVMAATTAKPSPQETIKMLQAEITDLKKQIASLKAENARLKGAAAPTTTVPPRARGGQSPFLAGNARPTYPAGTPDTVSIVYMAPFEPDSDGDAFQPFVVRNNTSKPVATIRVEATVYSGTIIEQTEENTDTVPAVIKPGQWAYGSISYHDVPPTQTAVKFSVTSSAPGEAILARGNLQIASADHVGDDITGVLTNTTAKTVDGFFLSLHAVCLDSSGNPSDIHRTRLGLNERVPPNAQHRYTIDVSEGSCDSFLVGATYVP